MPEKRPRAWERDLETDTRHSAVAWSRHDAPRVPGWTVLAHPDPARVGERAAQTGLGSRGTAPISRLEPRFAAPGSSNRRPLGDPHISRRPLVLRARGKGVLELDASGTGTRVTVGDETLDGALAIDAETLARGLPVLLAERVALLLHHLDPAPPADVPRFGLVGDSAETVTLRQHIHQVADRDVTVLLRGETGTGKELAAAAIHQASHRADAPFLTVNTGAIPPSLAAAELFGADRGAFTGADHARPGVFRRADGGTLFLDEVGELPSEVQPLLLRALESGEIQPVGAERVERVDVRVIAATDSDLEAAIADGRFRAPLFHRLAGYEIELPPLGARRDDIGRLLYAFLARELDAIGEGDRLDSRAAGDRPWLPAALVARLAALDWPGNVRQLANLARELVIASRGQDQACLGPQGARLLAPAPAAPEPAATGYRPPPPTRYRPPADVDEEELVAALRAHRWRLRPAARQLGVSRTSLYALIARSGRLRTAADVGRRELAASMERCGGDLERMVDELEVSEHGIRQRLRELGLGHG